MRQGALDLARKELPWIGRALRSSVAKNAAALYVIHVANYALPLISVPYLLRVIGPTTYGLVAFGQSLMSYLMILVDYGFALSATRRIAVEWEDIGAVSRTAANVWAAKGGLCLLALGILALLSSVVAKVREARGLMFILYGTVVGNALLPVWLFQGMEKMTSLAVIQFVVRALVVLGVFVLVRRPEDYMLYAKLIGLAGLGGGLIGAGWGWRKFGLKLVWPTMSGVREMLEEGWALFLSIAAVSVYTTGNPFLVGLLTNATVVGYYSIAEKVVMAVVSFLGPIAVAAYPRFSRMAAEERGEVLRWGKRMLVWMGGVGLGLAGCLVLGAPWIVQLVVGREEGAIVSTLRILALLPLPVALSNVLGRQMMLSLGYDRAFMAILAGAGLLNLALACLLVPLWRAQGMATTQVLVEGLIVVTMGGYLWRKVAQERK